MKKYNRADWWNEARFGMFLHWGLYAIPAVGEWIMYNYVIKIKDYEMLAHHFNPKKYNPRSWAKLARQAGMKYMVLTTKHHDGFCLFDTKLTGYNSVQTAAKRDLVAEYVDACREEGLRVGFYYSIKDWHHPNYPLPNDDPLVRLEPKARKPDVDKYFKYMVGQLKELLTNYGKIDVLWFDGTNPVFDGNKALAIIRKIQPDILVNNRLLADDKDFITPEQVIPDRPIIENGRKINWETCNTMTGNAWGYNKYDKNLRSADELIEMLVKSAAGGGNFLLNLGPHADGTIQPEEQRILKEIGRWMTVNGDSIYGTNAGPVSHLPDNRMTTKGNKIYLHLSSLPQKGKIRLPAFNIKPESAVLMSGEKLSIEKNCINVPKKYSASPNTVIAFDFKKTPKEKRQKQQKSKPLKVEYNVVPGNPVRIDGYINDLDWVNAKVLRISQNTHFDYSKERYPASYKYGLCAYNFRMMHAGGVLYIGVVVESPTRLPRKNLKYEGGDEVRLLFAANIKKEINEYSPETFEITVDSHGNTWMPYEEKRPGNIFRHAVRSTENGYNVVVGVPFSMMLKNKDNPGTCLKPGDLFKLNVMVVQPSPPYSVKKMSKNKKQNWWDKLEPPMPGPAHKLFWKGNSAAEGPFSNVTVWGVCKLMRYSENRKQ